MPIDPKDLDLPEGTDITKEVEASTDLTRQVFDAPLDLTKNEKLRVTALMMAINYHRETIVHDAAMYQQLKMDNKILSPTRAHKVVAQAVIFELYLRGGYDEAVAKFAEEDAAGTIEDGDMDDIIKKTTDDVFGKMPDEDDIEDRLPGEK